MNRSIRMQKEESYKYRCCQKKKKIQEEKERVSHGNSKLGVSEQRQMHMLEYKRKEIQMKVRICETGRCIGNNEWRLTTVNKMVRVNDQECRSSKKKKMILENKGKHITAVHEFPEGVKEK